MHDDYHHAQFISATIITLSLNGPGSGFFDLNDALIGILRVPFPDEEKLSLLKLILSLLISPIVTLQFFSTESLPQKASVTVFEYL